MKSLGLYIHAPFCFYKCPYCDFYSVKTDEKLMDDYLTSLKGEIEKWGKKTDKTVDTLYFGGGTPTLMGERLVEIIKSVKQNFKCKFKEVTVEANPFLLSSDLISKYKDAGVNRISLGAQSSNDYELKKLGRRHRREDIERLVETVKETGIDNISLDLMIGISGQTEESLAQTVDFYSGLNVKHISGYMLKIEKDTPYFKLKNSLNLPDDDRTIELYFKMVELMKKSGFNQYEISNFSKENFEGRHNLKYWSLEEYIGIGPSAYGFFEGSRYHYSPSLENFIESPQIISDGVGGDVFEKIMLELRRSKGISLADLPNNIASKLTEALKKVPPDCFKFNDGWLSLTTKGFAVSNSIIVTLTEDL